MNQLVPIAVHVPALVQAAGERAQTRFWEFFVFNIRTPTRGVPTSWRCKNFSPAASNMASP
jgi:hypothetical protein